MIAELETETETKEILSRQSTLKLKTPNSICIIGVGGVGFWVAHNFALAGVDKLLLIDPDVVESTNRNRTGFRFCDEGKPKVIAMSELILERRYCDIVAIQERVENLPADLFLDYGLVIDCRDTTDPLDEPLMKKQMILGGYDGSQITIHINPSGDSTWGESTSYSIVPSWIAPPQLIAIIIQTYVSCCNQVKGEFINTFNIKDLIDLVALPARKEKVNGNTKE